MMTQKPDDKPNTATPAEATAKNAPKDSAAAEAPFDAEAETEALCASLEKTFRAAIGQMPNQLQLSEIHGLQASIRDLVKRAEDEGTGAILQLKELAAERDRHKGDAERARADFLNYQARAKKDRERAEELSLRGYVSDLLPVLDSLDLSLANSKQPGTSVETVGQALEMIADAMKQALHVRGLERIEPLGKPFDANLHEAVHKRPADATKNEQPGQVVEVFRSGYLWKGLVLRPAQVLVTEVPPAEKKA